MIIVLGTFQSHYVYVHMHEIDIMISLIINSGPDPADAQKVSKELEPITNITTSCSRIQCYNNDYSSLDEKLNFNGRDVH